MTTLPMTAGSPLTEATIRWRTALVLVITRHREAMIGHVQHEIASHDVQADHAEMISLW